MSDAMPYVGLRRGSRLIWLSTPEGTDGYALRRPLSLPSARALPEIVTARRVGTHINRADPLGIAERALVVDCSGSTAEEAETSLAGLRDVFGPGCELLWSAGEDRTLLRTTVRDWHITEPETDPLRRETGALKQLRVNLTLWTDGPWTAQDGVTFGDTVAATPGHLDVADVPGDIPALLDMTVTSTDARGALGVGLRHEPSADYQYADDYSGTADAACYGGQKSAAYNLPTSWAASAVVATPPAIDVLANAGRSFALARLTNSAVSASHVLYRLRSSSTGSGALADTVSANGLAVMAGAAGAFELVNLGPVTTPCAGMPDLDGAAGYEIVIELNAENDGELLLATTTGEIRVRQTFPDMDLESFEYTVTSAPSTTLVFATAMVSMRSGAVMWVNLPTTPGTHAVVLPAWAQGAYAIDLQLRSGTLSWTFGVAHSNGDYSDGALTQTKGTGVSAGDDLTFLAYGRRARGFTAADGVQAMCSASGKTARIDVLTRLPIDWWALLTYKAFTAGQGLLIQSNPNGLFDAFLCNDDGDVGHSLLGDSVVRGVPALWPGTNRLVFAGDHPGSLTISGTYWPRYSDAAAGEL